MPVALLRLAEEASARIASEAVPDNIEAAVPGSTVEVLLDIAPAEALPVWPSKPVLTNLTE